jgi:hypothetical protein
MAEIVLSDADLARIDRDLDGLVFPSRETMRALVAETRRLRAECQQFAGGLAQMDSIIHQIWRTS